MYQLYQVDGSSNWIQCKPDAFYAKEDGSVKVVVSSSANKYKLVLSSVPDSQTDEGGDGFTLTNQANSYLFYTCYEELTSGPEFAAGYTRSAVEPDTVQYDDTDKTTTFSFDPASAVSNIRFVYEYGIIRTNEIYLSSAAPSSGIGASTRSPSPAFSLMASADTAPQMTLYGIGHDIAYGDQKRQYRRGWVNHIDSYRSPSTAHIVAGLGGNLYAEREQELAPTNFVMPTYYPELFARVSAKTILGPAFSGSNNDRTRGVYSFTGGGDGLAEVTGVAYNAASNKVVYTLNVPGFAITSATTPIDANDFLTVDGMSYKRHNGTFQISAPPTVVDANTITISVSNPDVDSTDYDDANTSGYAGVFTDRFTASANSPLLVGDRLLSSSWDESTTLTISSVNAAAPTVVYLSGCIKRLELGTNLAVTGQRTSATIPLRTVSRGANNESVNYLIPGDTVSVSGVADPLQILSVDATNKTITLDRSITWSDTISLPTTISVAARWLPVEAPTSSTDGALIPTTSVRYFTSSDYDNQAFLRSAMVQNNLYLTNGSDEVYKYDGENNYRAGIIPWQPGLFLTTETGAVGGIPLTGASFNALIQPNGVELAKADALQLPVGSICYYTDTANTTPILVTVATNTDAGSSKHLITFNDSFNPLPSGTGGKLTLTYTARYCFRLNIKDVNGVTTASAVTGAEDFVAIIAPTTNTAYKIHLRLVGLPAWDQYDFRNKNIEVEIYRTLWTTGSVGEVPKFFRLPQTKTCSFTGADGYIDLEDSYGNNTLTDLDLVVSVLSPSIVPAGWDEPPRAKYTTTAGNRLVLANLTDWPTMSISYLPTSSVSNTNFNGQVFHFYKDAENIPTTAPDMVNHVAYQLRSSGATAVSSVTTSLDQFTFTTIPPREIVGGDWVYISFAATNGHPPSISGWWQIASATPYTVGNPVICTVNCVGTLTNPTPTHPVTALFATTAKVIPVNVNTDYNMGMFNGNGPVSVLNVIRRLGMAINATMRMVNVSLDDYKSFKPWLVARSESDTVGQLVVKQPRAETTVPAMKVSSVPVPTYLNGSQLTDNIPAAAAITRYPSRLAVSYDNYPEIFDSLWVVDTDSSDSVIDVNSADGQEITGVIPFFGESAFGAAQKAGVLVVFKQNSIYLVNVAAKIAGQEAVQRLETQGLGCTAPYSIAPTKNGIMFANESGIYALRTDQRIEYLGRFMERNWQEKVDLGALAIAQGHHYGVGRQYKLSVPMVAESSSTYAENSQAYVYNHTAEADGELGGWTRYTNHPVTGWANLFQDAFLATANGSVMKVRNLGGVTDYRDGNVAIESILAARANAFGNTGIRKAVANLVVHYRSGANSKYTKVYTSPDLFDVYQESTLFRVVTKSVQDGLSSTSGQAIVSIMHTFPRRRCIYMSVTITNNGIDDNVEIAGMSYIVAGLSSSGIKQAAETTD
jgi:hypothetical protein